MDFTNLASQESVDKTVAALGENGFEAVVVENKAEALEKIKELIPQGASVMNGASRTLEQIGFVDYLKSGEHPWNNLHAGIVAATGDEQRKVRREALTSDFYLGSVHALAEVGEFIVASNTGSQLPHLVFSSPNLILVVSTKKIVPDLETGMKRLHDHVIPLEDENMMQKYQVHTNPSKILFFRKEVALNQRKITLLLVKEDLGF